MSLYKPLSEEEIAKILKLIKEYDLKNNINRAPYPAYISGIACTQLLGIQIDNHGNVWCCPARKRIINGDVKEIPLTEDKTKDYLTLWNEDISANMRETYNGCCIYKGQINRYE